VATIAPFGLYLVVSLIVLGHLVLGDIGSRTLGSGPDPAAFVWIVKWWPQAVANGWNPLHTDVVYAPEGFNMTWVTSIPGPSFALAPLTQLVGPIVSYNVLVILTPALNGWAAFMLCRGLGARYPAALLGGYVFGFSTYVMNQSAGHPQAALVALLPLSVLLATKFQQRRISPRWLLIGMSCVLTAQFLVSVEVFLTMTMFGGLAIALALLMFDEDRVRIVELSKLVLSAYLITAVMVSPYLYANLSEPNTLTGIDPLPLSTDPLSVVVPTHLTAIGGSLFESISNRFTGSSGEQGAYIGVPLLLLLCLFAWRRRSDRIFRFVLVMMVFGFIAALGPRLNLLGHVTAIRLPWTPFIHLPITEYIIPSRLIVYAWLPAAVAVALGLSRLGGRVSWALGIVGAALLLPATGATNLIDGEPYWSSSRPVPDFFRNAASRALPRKGTVLVIPYSVAGQGESMIWQAESDMGFAMPDGYLSSVIPPSFACWPVEGALRGATYNASQRSEFLAFIASKDVRAVVVSTVERRSAEPLLAALPGKPKRFGGVYVFRVPSAATARITGDCPGSGS
jgi:hypothetical protein